jgi:hypothetical protein
VNPEDFLAALRTSLVAIDEPVCYLDGREGTFQARLFTELLHRLPGLGEVAQDFRLEQEVTKTIKLHGFRKRPDLILHKPFELGITGSRTDGNFACMELKVRAGCASALKDYEKLAKFCDQLNYDLGIFINIGRSDTHRDAYDGPHGDRIHGFGVVLQDGVVTITPDD